MEWISSVGYILLKSTAFPLTSLHPKRNSSTTQPRSLTSGTPRIGNPLRHHCFLTSLFLWQAGSLFLLNSQPGTLPIRFCRSCHSGLCSYISSSERPFSTALPKIPCDICPIINWPFCLLYGVFTTWHYQQLHCLFGNLFIFCLPPN